MNEIATSEKIIRYSAIIWASCILIVIAGLGYVSLALKDTLDKVPDMYGYVIAGFVLLGCLAFLIGSISFTTYALKSRSTKKQNVIIFLIKLFFSLAILPVFAFFYFLQPLTIVQRVKQFGVKGLFKSIYPRLILQKVMAFLFIGFVVLPVWVGGYALVGLTAISVLGYGSEMITISGTGSMAPTFPKGEGTDPKELSKQIVGTPGMTPYPNGLVIAGKRYFGYQIGRGDIVVVENDLIREMTKSITGEETGWVKRIVGMPGDTLEIRGGIVYLNQEPFKEQYTAQPRSTFGETFLKECQKVTVPDDYIFVMGDNRKGSGDSREIGFIEIGAINHVLSLKNQKGLLDKDWRDTAKDFEEGSKIRLDKDKYLELLNEKRKEVGAKPLKYQSKLEVSATKRGENILKYDDYSFEATRSGYTMTKALRDANYSNVTYGEAPRPGYYSADELIDNQFQFPESKKFLTDKNYQEIGISEVEGDVNGCPSQVIVQHFAGYVPPNYKKEDVASWRKVANELKDIQSGWANLKNNASFYQNNKSDVDRINEIINIRIGSNSAIASRMEANQWLTSAEQKMADQDKALYEEMDALANKLNNK